MAANFSLPFEAPIEELERRIEELRNFSAGQRVSLADDIRELEQKRDQLIKTIYSELSPWNRVRVARHQNRPTVLDYMRTTFDEFVELHGDRKFGDDRAIVAGLARLDGRKLFIIGQQKGRTTKEKLTCNFGMPHPEGFRKAMRVMHLAEKFGLPILALIDTPGAYPGVGAEERGQAFAIAENLMDMARLRTPLICVVIGEGGSGGALGIGAGDILALLEYSYYSVISPEGCAAILWRSGDNAPDAATALKLTAPELLELGLVDDIIPEPLGGAHRDPEEMAATLKKKLEGYLDQLAGVPVERLLEERYRKYRTMGVFLENGDVVGEVKRKPPDSKT